MRTLTIALVHDGASEQDSYDFFNETLSPLLEHVDCDVHIVEECETERKYMVARALGDPYTARQRELAQLIPHGRIAHAMRSIVDYNWPSEQRDYEEQVRDGNIEPDDPNSRHVYLALRTVDEFLSSLGD